MAELFPTKYPEFFKSNETVEKVRESLNEAKRINGCNYVINLINESLIIKNIDKMKAEKSDMFTELTSNCRK